MSKNRRYVNTKSTPIADMRAFRHRFESIDRAGERAGERAGHNGFVDTLVAAGLGLDYGIVRLGRTTSDWLDAGAALRAHVAQQLAVVTVDVEQIGSSAVLGLLAKPIVDLAVGLHDAGSLSRVGERLVADGWIYRGDAGDDGGRVFVLEARPRHRVAHLHVVEHDGVQWRDYLRLRDLLRTSAQARARYETVKLRLADHHPDDRNAYTDGKDEIVKSLLSKVD